MFRPVSKQSLSSDFVSLFFSGVSNLTGYPGSHRRMRSCVHLFSLGLVINSLFVSLVRILMLSNSHFVSNGLPWNVDSLGNISFKFYYLTLTFVGLGFRLKKLTFNLVKLFLVRPNYFYLFVPQQVVFVLPRLGRYARVKRVLLCGYSLFVLNCLAHDILLLRLLSPYRLYGILNPKSMIIYRSGKQR